MGQLGNKRRRGPQRLVPVGEVEATGVQEISVLWLYRKGLKKSRFMHLT